MFPSFAARNNYFTMLTPKRFLSLALPLLSLTTALDIDTSKPDSLKAVAKTLAGGIIATYNKYQTEENPGPGLFSDSGEPYYWYQGGLTFNALISYAHLTGDKQYNAAIVQALTHQVGDFNAFMPPNQTKTLGNDDQSTWGLAALTAAETGLENPKGLNVTWLDMAKTVFNTQVLRWDTEKCNGGLKWQIFTFNQGYNYKNSPSNSQFFLLAARLAQITGNQNKTYVEWAEKSYQWANTIGLVSNYTVYDGTDDKTNCSQINRIQWSSWHGAYTEGSAILYNLTSGAQTWKDAVTGFYKSGSVFRSNETGVLYEAACEGNGKCDVDQRAFKAIAARSLARAALYAPIIADDVRKTLEATAKAAAAGCSGDGQNLKCAHRWVGGDADARTVSVNGLGEATNALEVVQGLLYTEAKLGNGTSSQSPAASGTPTGSAKPTEKTGAAPKMAVAWSGVTIAGMVAAAGLL